MKHHGRLSAVGQLISEVKKRIRETKINVTNHNTGNLLGGKLGGRTQVGGVPKE